LNCTLFRENPEIPLELDLSIFFDFIVFSSLLFKTECDVGFISNLIDFFA